MWSQTCPRLSGAWSVGGTGHGRPLNSHPIPPGPAQSFGQHGLGHSLAPGGRERAGRMLGEAVGVWSTAQDQRTVPGPAEPQPGPGG